MLIIWAGPVLHSFTPTTQAPPEAANIPMRNYMKFCFDTISSKSGIEKSKFDVGSLQSVILETYSVTTVEQLWDNQNKIQMPFLFSEDARQMFVLGLFNGTVPYSSASSPRTHAYKFEMFQCYTLCY